MPRRRSGAVRHARKVLVIGDSNERRRLMQVLGAYFGDGLDQRLRLPEAIDDSVDAVLILDEPTSGDLELAALTRLASGRQLVVDLAVLAAAVDDKLLMHERATVAGMAVVKHAGYFMPGYSSRDQLPWWGTDYARPGSEFVWGSEQAGLRIVLQSLDRKIYAAEVELTGGRLGAMDLGALECAPETGFRDLAAMFLLEALGAEQVDLGVFDYPFPCYADYVKEIEAWCAQHAEVVSIRELNPASVSGQRLRRVDVGDTTQRPAALFTCVTHGHERGPSLGVFAWLRDLLADFQRGGAWGRTVLQEIGIVWIPVVCADGFQRTWAAGELVPYGTNWVDLNRNFGPDENWAQERTRPKGDRPFSEPEAQAVKAVVDDLMPRLKVHIDFHEQTQPGSITLTPNTPFQRDVYQSLSQGFNHRYLHEGLSGYARSSDLSWQNYHPARGSSQPVGVCSGYARSMGVEGGTGETFGNDDFTPFHLVSRVDATASMAEAFAGALLGRTAYNHRCQPIALANSFESLDADRKIEYQRIDASGQLAEKTMTTAGTEFEMQLGSGERMLAIAHSH